ncbi:uncharacterized protein DUF4262 [Kribbella amoyensis]|uniref:Uncharacterized protein DUF4262 n=1 Tax=Kribbella amoyensis TaxID=996641 RepID=A0A561BXN6_9ACTN|nr:DUF4262 domain-containing protein [Kribbella amoyensis]TWD83598.1 uncharacterized protein DUF4262 [Kribbella amoyensis]
MCDLCNGATEHDYRQYVIRAIQRYGWAVQYVEGDGARNPSFAYTVGLSRVRHPEFIVFDCSAQRGYHALAQLAWQVAAGMSFDEGDNVNTFYPPPERAALLRFPDSSTHLFTANDLYRRDGDPPLPALQLLWPDPLALLRRPVEGEGVR